MSSKLELRMYGFVPYNISPIQQAIQFGHAVVEYGQMIKGKTKQEIIYDDWANNWKTFIILNGGTTNHKTSLEDGLPFGSLNNHLLTLVDNNIEFAKLISETSSLLDIQDLTKIAGFGFENKDIYLDTYINT